jgi:hypothetical protein
MAGSRVKMRSARQVSGRKDLRCTGDLLEGSERRVYRRSAGVTAPTDDAKTFRGDKIAR